MRSRVLVRGWPRSPRGTRNDIRFVTRRAALLILRSAVQRRDAMTHFDGNLDAPFARKHAGRVLKDEDRAESRLDAPTAIVDQVVLDELCARGIPLWF